MPAVELYEPRPWSAPRSDDRLWPILPPTLVTIHRTSLADEQSRQIVCRLDDGSAVSLLFGDTLTVEVAPGPHTLRIHNTLVWKTARFEVAPGAHVHFTVWNRPCRGHYWLLFLVGAAPLWLELHHGLPG